MKQVLESDLVNIGNVTFLLPGQCAINQYVLNLFSDLAIHSHLSKTYHCDLGTKRSSSNLDLVVLRLIFCIFHQHNLYSAEDGGMSGEPTEDREQGQWTDCGGCSAA